MTEKKNSNPRHSKKSQAKQAKDAAQHKRLSDDESINIRPAFRRFVLEDESLGRRRMRSFGKGGDDPRFAPNSWSETWAVYCDALGNRLAKWTILKNHAGKEVFCEKRTPATPENAARDLLTIAKNATTFLSELLNRKPELCRLLAVRSSEWPVMVDLTEKDWRRAIVETVSKLELGKDVKGFLLSARTADENVIRCWVTAIYDTLFQTRFDYKSALKKHAKFMTTQGCPPWARKTLELPPFTKADSRKWAKLGEEMLLEQCPAFLDSPDLVQKKRSWTHRAQKDSRSGNASLRAIHREAFEDFAKELKNIAPESYPSNRNW